MIKDEIRTDKKGRNKKTNMRGHEIREDEKKKVEKKMRHVKR